MVVFTRFRHLPEDQMAKFVAYGAYGGPEIEQADQRLVSATPSAGGLSVRLVVDQLVIGHIHELHLPGLRDRAGQRLLHDVAYYTLNRIPKP